MNNYCPKNKADWRAWLEKNHETEDSIWLVFYKKGTPKENLTWSEAVDEALCFGWIDSTKKTINNEKYIQYYSKRKPKSIWSKINKDKVTYLSKQGLINDKGYASINIAKKNGSWSMMDSVEAGIIPNALLEELQKREGAKAYFDSLSKSVKKMFLTWIVLAKRPETKQKRIIEIAKNASKNLKPKHFR